MATPRRQIVRAASSANDIFGRQVKAQKLRARLDSERAALARWQRKLRRAFNAVEKHQRAIARLEGQLTRKEES